MAFIIRFAETRAHTEQARASLANTRGENLAASTRSAATQKIFPRGDTRILKFSPMTGKCGLWFAFLASPSDVRQPSRSLKNCEKRELPQSAPAPIGMRSKQRTPLSRRAFRGGCAAALLGAQSPVCPNVAEPPAPRRAERRLGPRAVHLAQSSGRVRRVRTVSPRG